MDGLFVPSLWGVYNLNLVSFSTSGSLTDGSVDCFGPKQHLSYVNENGSHTKKSCVQRKISDLGRNKTRQRKAMLRNDLIDTKLDTAYEISGPRLSRNSHIPTK